MIGMVVPVMVNFKGFTELMRSVDIPVKPIVLDNWVNNVGVSKSWNWGLTHAQDCEALFIVNDDVTFAPGAMSKMLDAIQDFDLVSAIGGDHDQTGVHEIIDNGSPDYAAFVIKPEEFLDKFGLFDENFTPAYFEDNDMRYRIKVSGGRQGIVLDARMYHYGSYTQNHDGQRVVSHQMFEANRDYYVRKWGGTPGEETYINPFNDVSKTLKDW